MDDDAALPGGLRLSVAEPPAPEARAAIAAAIHGFHARTVPQDTRRLGWLLHDAGGALVAGLLGTLSWQWLFVEALWVAEDRRGQGLGRLLMARAEAAALAAGCHSAWLDTFQAAGFYRALGYVAFGALEDYPPGQTRHFLRKRLDQG